MDDFKFLAVFMVLPLAFWAWSSGFDFSGAEFHGTWETPTVTFVDADDPRGMTMEEWSRQRHGWIDTP